MKNTRDRRCPKVFSRHSTQFPISSCNYQANNQVTKQSSASKTNDRAPIPRLRFYRRENKHVLTRTTSNTFETFRSSRASNHISSGWNSDSLRERGIVSKLRVECLSLIIIRRNFVLFGMSSLKCHWRKESMRYQSRYIHTVHEMRNLMERGHRMGIDDPYRHAQLNLWWSRRFRDSPQDETKKNERRRKKKRDRSKTHRCPRYSPSCRRSIKHRLKKERWIAEARLKTGLALVTRCQRNEAVGCDAVQVGCQMARTETVNEETKRNERNTLCSSHRANINAWQGKRQPNIPILISGSVILSISSCFV